MSSISWLLHTLTLLSISMVEYVMDELQDYAKLVDETTGIEVGGFDQQKNLAHLFSGLLCRRDLAL